MTNTLVRHRFGVALLQLVLGIGLIVFLFLKMDNRADVLDALRAIGRHCGFGVAAVVCFFGCLLFATLRWKRILEAHGLSIPFSKVLRLNFIGQFFNAFMFGAVGGDAVKIFSVAKTFPDCRAEAVTTVFIDRMLGMLSLIGLAAAVLLFRIRFFMRYPETRTVAVALAVALTTMLIMLVLAFRRNLFESLALFRRLETQTRLGGILSRIYRSFHGCLTRPWLMVETLLLSLINHVLFILAACLLGIGLEIRTVPPIDPPRLAVVQAVVEFGTYMTVFPVINGIAAIPATPGGLGTRDTATKVLLGVPEFNVPGSRAVTLSLLLYAVTLFWSLVGGLVYAFSTIRR